MLEGLLADLLSSVLGQYVEGISRDSISAEIWGGNLELKGLALKEEALAVFFESLGVVLPVTVQAGIIGLLKVQIPWKYLGSQPCKISMEDMTIIARPVVNDGSSANEAHRREMRLKKARLAQDDAVREASLRVLNARESESQEGSETWASAFTDRLMSRILDNLQIELHDIVIRFEDAISDPKHPYAASLHLRNVKAVSTDESWNQRFLDFDTSTAIHKVVELKGLFIDWVSLDQYSEDVAFFSGERNGESATTSSLRRLAFDSDHRTTNEKGSIKNSKIHPERVLFPVNGTLRASLRKPWTRSSGGNEDSGERNSLSAMVELDFQFPEVAVAINEVQYASLLQTAGYFAKLATRGFRPQNAKQWWLWSMEQILPGFSERHRDRLCLQQSELLKRRAEREKYIAARVSVLKARRTDIDLVGPLVQDIAQMEAQLSFSDIVLYRDLADEQMIKEMESWERQSTSETTGTSTGVFWSLLGYGSSSTVQKPKPDVVDKPHVSKEDRREEGRPKPESVTLQVGFLLQKASIKTFRRGFPFNPVPLMEMIFSRLHVGMITTQGGSMTLEVLLGNLQASNLERGTPLIYPRVKSRYFAASGFNDWPGNVALRSSYPQGVSEALNSIRSGVKTDPSHSMEPTIAEELGKDSRDVQDPGSEEDTFTRDPMEASDNSFKSTRSSAEIPTVDISDPLAGEDHRSDRGVRYIAAVRLEMRSMTPANTPEVETDQMSLDVAIDRLEVILDGPKGSLIRGLRFWQPKSDSELPVFTLLGAAAGARIAQLRVELKRAVLEKHGPMQVNLMIHAPRFIVPSAELETPALVIDLGTLALQTLPNATRDDDVSFSNMGHTRVHYTAYRLKLMNLGICVAPSSAEAQNMKSLHNSEAGVSSTLGVESVITPISLHFVVQLLRDAKTVEAAGLHREEDSLGIAKFAISGEIPSVSLVLSKRAYRGILSVAELWRYTPSLDSSPPQEMPKVETEASPASNLLVSHSAPVSLASVSAKLLIKRLSLELRDAYDCRIVVASVSGMQVNGRKRGSSSLSAEFKLANWSIVDGRQEAASEFSRLACTGVTGGKEEELRNQGPFDESSSSAEEMCFVSLSYDLDVMRHKQCIKLHILSLDILCVREIYIKLASFFYQGKSRKGSVPSLGSKDDIITDEYTDPFEIVGSSTSEAATRFAAGTETLVGSSAAAIAEQGQVHLEAVLDGLKLTLVGGDRALASIEVHGLGVRLDRTEDGTIHSSGNLNHFVVQDLITSMKAYSNVLSYSCPVGSETCHPDSLSTDAGPQMQDGWTLNVPRGEEGEIFFSTSLQGIKVVYLYRFSHMIQQYFRNLLAALRPALLAAKLVSVGVNEISSSVPSQIHRKPSTKGPRCAFEIYLRNSEILLPRHSRCAHEALVISVNSVVVTRDKLLSNRLKLRFSEVGAVVNYLRRGEIANNPSRKEPLCAGIAGEMNLFFPQGAGPAPRSRPKDPSSDKNSSLSKVEPGVQGSSFVRMHLNVTRSTTLTICEAQYSVLYFILTENFFEISNPSLTEISFDGDWKTTEASDSLVEVFRGNDGKELPEETEGAVHIPDSDAEDVSSQFTFDIPDIRFTVAFGDTLAIPSNYVVQLRLARLGGKVDVFQSSTIQVDTRANLSGVFAFEDEGASPDSYIPFVIPLVSSEKESLLFSYRAMPQMPREVTVSLPQVRLFCLPLVIRGLGQLAIPGWRYLDSSDEPPPCPYLGRSISVSVPKAEIILFCPSDRHIRQMIRAKGWFSLSLLFQRGTGEKTVFLNSKDLTMDMVQDIDSAENRVRLLYPCNTSLKYVSSRENGQQSTIQGNACDVLCRINTGDVPIIVAILREMISRGHRKNLAARFPCLGDKLRQSGSMEMTATQAQITSRFEVSVAVDDARLILVEDTVEPHTPVLETRMASFVGEGSLPWVCHVSVTCGVECFNDKKGWWEPALELCTTKLVCNRGRSGSLAISLNSDTPVNINVTSVITKRVLRAAHSMGVFMSDIDSTKRVAREHTFNEQDLTTDGDKKTSRALDTSSDDLSVASFWFCNELGSAVQFRLSHEKSFRTVASGERVDISLSCRDLVSGHRDSTAAAGRLKGDPYQCFVSLDGGANVVVLSAAQNDLQYLRFERGLLSHETSVPGDHVMIIWEVKMRGGVPNGTLRSLIRVRNNTKRLLEIWIQETEREEEEKTEIRCGEYINLPVGTEHKSIRFRPSSQPVEARRGHELKGDILMPAWRWSDTLPSISFLRAIFLRRSGLMPEEISDLTAQQIPPQVRSPEVKMIHVTSRSIGEPEATFTVAIDAQIGMRDVVSGKATGSSARMDIVLNPPVTVQNKLPGQVAMRIAYSKNGNSHPPKGHLVDSLEEFHVHSIEDGLRNLGVSVTYGVTDHTDINAALSKVGKLQSVLQVAGAGSKQGTLVPLEPEPTLNSRSFQKYVPLRARIVRLTEYTSHVKLSLEAEFWIRNRSDIPLTFCESEMYHGARSAPRCLHAAPPGSRAGPYVPFTGPYVSFKISENDDLSHIRDFEIDSLSKDGTDGSQDMPRLSPRAPCRSWWDCPQPLRDLDKPITLNLPGVSLIMDIRPAAGSYRGSSVLTIRNAVWIVNRTDYQIQWCQSTALDSHGIIRSKHVHNVPQQEAKSIHWDFSSKPKHVCIRITKGGKAESDWIWSRAVPISVGDKAEVAVKMYQPKAYQQYIARVVTLERPGGSVLLVVYPEDRKNPPYRITNLCNTRSIAFKQNGSEGKPWLIRPSKSTRYTWDNPLESAERRKLVIEVIEPYESKEVSHPLKGKDIPTSAYEEFHHPEFSLSIDVVAEKAAYLTETFQPPLQVSVKLDGPTKIVTFFDVSAASAVSRSLVTFDEAAPIVRWDDLHRLNLKLTKEFDDNKETEQRGEQRPSKPGRPESSALNMDISLTFVGVSLIDSSPLELAYITANKVNMRFEAFESTRILSFNIEKFQVDNQLPNPPYPVMLWAAPLGYMSSESGFDSASGSFGGASESYGKMCAVRISQTSTIDEINMYKGVYAAVQPLNLALDDEIALRLQILFFELFHSQGTDNDEMLDGEDPEQRSLLTVVPQNLGQNVGIEMSRIHVEELIFFPVCVCVSFATSRGGSDSSSIVMEAHLRALLAILGNVENCEFDFPKLELHHVFDTFQHFYGLVWTYYATIMNNQKLRLVSSNALVGNPAALFDSISVGARDFFVEPGRARDSEEFLASIGRGSRSFLANTVGGIVGSLGGIPRAVATGLESAVGDREYLKERRLIRKQGLGGEMRSNSSSATQGLITGARSFGHGIASGVKGLFRDPVVGAKSDGATGFLRGLGSGIAGSVIKPVAGALDLIGEPAASIRSSVSANQMRKRGITPPEPYRPPRTFLGSDCRLGAYDLRVAIGSALLQTPTIVSRTKVKEHLSCWIELSARPDRNTFTGLQYAWTIIRRHLRNMPGARKILRAEMREAAKKEKRLLSVSRPEKTRIALLTDMRLVICTWDGQLIKDHKLNEILDVHSPQGTTDQLIVGTGARGSTVGSRRPLRPSAIHAIQCGSRDARDELRLALSKVSKGISSVPVNDNPEKSQVSKDIPMVDMSTLENSGGGRELQPLVAEDAGSYFRRTHTKNGLETYQSSARTSQKFSKGTATSETSQTNDNGDEGTEEESLRQLLELGFERRASIDALRESSGDTVRAIDKLLADK